MLATYRQHSQIKIMTLFIHYYWCFTALLCKLHLPNFIHISIVIKPSTKYQSRHVLCSATGKEISPYITHSGGKGALWRKYYQDIIIFPTIVFYTGILYIMLQNKASFWQCHGGFIKKQKKHVSCKNAISTSEYSIWYGLQQCYYKMDRNVESVYAVNVRVPVLQ